MAHLFTALFFTLVFLGAGAAAQAMLRTYRREIAAALAGQVPVFTVTLRPAAAPLRAAA